MIISSLLSLFQRSTAIHHKPPSLLPAVFRSMLQTTSQKGRNQSKTHEDKNHKKEGEVSLATHPSLTFMPSVALWTTVV